MGVAMSVITFEAWEGRFTRGQVRDIIQMSLFADNNGLKLHEALQHELDNKPETRVEKSDKGFVKKPIFKCPECGGVLKLFSLNKRESDEHPGMVSKFECCKTCKSSGCGYKQYSIKDVETIIEEVRDGSSK